MEPAKRMTREDIHRRSCARKLTVLLAVAVMWCCARPAAAQGLPEPGVIFYGTVTNSAGTILTNGTLNWTLTRGTSVVQIFAPITNVGGQFVYVVEVPFETVLSGQTVSANTLAFPTSQSTVGRGAVLSGTNLVTPTPSAGIFQVGTLDRGRVSRLDLLLNSGGTITPPPLIFAWQPSVTLVRTNAATAIPVTLSVGARNATSFQWSFQGTSIPGATGTAYTINDARRTNNGTYSVTVAGPGGVTTTNGVFYVIVPQRMQSPVRLANGKVILSFADIDGGLATDLSRLELLVTTNLSAPIIWTTNTTGFGLTNGVIQFGDAAAATSPYRFYRVTERSDTSLTTAPINMAFIPAGEFQMGDSVDGSANSGPVHSVYVSAFYLDNNLVTKALWDEVYVWAIAHGYNFDNAGSGKALNHPVQTINWYDCVKWCNARSEQEGRVPAYYTFLPFWENTDNVYRQGRLEIHSSFVNWNTGYRLPTEAEWEKAARGGLSGKRFPWGDTISQSQANYLGKGLSHFSGYDLSTLLYHPSYNTGALPYTSPVGSFAANGYGLYDMAGNLKSWCWDHYFSYSSDSQVDPLGLEGDINFPRVIRGGSWNDRAVSCRSDSRTSDIPFYGTDSVGFRSVLPAGQP